MLLALNTRMILIIAAAVLGALLIVTVFVALVTRKKKTVAGQTIDDRALVESNSKFVDILIALAKGDDALIEELKKMQEKLKYLIPTNSEKLYDYDKKIKHELEDFKIALTKADGKPCAKAPDYLKSLDVLVAERNLHV